MTSAGTPTPRPSPSAIFRTMAEGGVLFSSETEVYFGVNTVGAIIWELLPKATTVEQLCATLTERFHDVGPERIRHDVLSFISDLRANGLVVDGAETGRDHAAATGAP
ncbi:MAG: PqqD family protein [Gemmatimonadetes bacterium]|nr:PqqD family protein [Gemmatimonadota bacterium]